MTLHHEFVGPPDAPRSIWFVHGILGRGRNWKSFARRLLDSAPPGWRAVLIDLRGHGDSPLGEPPHDLEAHAADLAALAGSLGEPEVIVGHSFGGKVVTTWARRHALRAPVLWVLDSPPGSTSRGEELAGDPAKVIRILRTAPVPSPDRDLIRVHLRQAGLSEDLVSWLLTSAVRDDLGWRLVWDLDAIEQMLASYLATDLWSWLETTSLEVHLVRAGRSDRWTDDDLWRAEDLAAEGRIRMHLLPEAGHWLHVDSPERVRELLATSLTPPRS